MTSQEATVLLKLDGTERLLPIHGIKWKQVLKVLRKIHVPLKDFDQIIAANVQPGKVGFEALRFMLRVAALGLTFPGGKRWTPEEVELTFKDPKDIGLVFGRIVQLSKLPGGKPIMSGEQ